VGGVNAVVGVPGDRRPAPRALRGPLQNPEQCPLGTLQAPLRPRLVVVASPPTRPLYSPECVEGLLSEVRIHDPAYRAVRAAEFSPIGGSCASPSRAPCHAVGCISVPPDGRGFAWRRPNRPSGNRPRPRSLRAPGRCHSHPPATAPRRRSRSEATPCASRFTKTPAVTFRAFLRDGGPRIRLGLSTAL
jgi:hypothetical protein